MPDLGRPYVSDVLRQAGATNHRTMRAGPAWAAVLEVLGVDVAGQLVMFALATVVGIELRNPLAGLTAQISSPDLLAATRDLGVLLLLQYAGWLLLIVPIGWWHRRRSPAEYGLTKAGAPVATLIVAGVVTFAAGEFAAKALEAVNAVVPLGATAPWRQAVFEMSWTRWEFWLFTAVGSYAFVAFAEELFYRGYCQRRLAEDLGDGPAIVGVAALFTFSHGQYLIANPYSIGMVASLLLGSLAFGYIYARTRSLIPSVVAHVLVNIPATLPFQLATLVAMGVVVWLARRQIADALRRGIGWIREAAPRWLVPGMAVGGAAFAIVNQRASNVVLPAGIVGLVVAIGLGFREKRSG